MPWHALQSAAICLTLCGGGGVVYVCRVIRHARLQSGYTPDAEDWLWYAALPLSVYLFLFGAGIGLVWHPAGSLFAIAAAVLLLLFIGIHNAWDTVTYVAITRQHQLEKAEGGD
jgi:hypothetical protein